jgi:endoglucanase
VPYPSTPENIVPNLAQEPTLWEKFSVSEYGYDRWNAKRIENEIEFARAWADQNHVPIYCGEFGVHRKVVDPADRDRWLHDMRVALEKNGIGWAMWDYQTDFGVVTKQDGKTMPDAGVVEALGLKPAKH